jgi:hypothetical protein
MGMTLKRAGIDPESVVWCDMNMGIVQGKVKANKRLK